MHEKRVQAGVLDIAYREYGAIDGWPCILSHGFPYDPHAYAETAPLLAQQGVRSVPLVLGATMLILTALAHQSIRSHRWAEEQAEREIEEAAEGAAQRHADHEAAQDAVRAYRAALQEGH